MKRRAVLLTICAIPLGACASTTAIRAEFVVRVDSISGPTAVSGGIPAQQRLWGTVGPAGCTAFKELRTTRLSSQMDVTVIGERADATCASGATAALNGLVVQIEPPILGNFLFVVHQPDGSALQRSILGE
jgi:hypothetical protein